MLDDVVPKALISIGSLFVDFLSETYVARCRFRILVF